MVKTDEIIKVENTFKEKFGSKPQLFTSPGRINIIGEHTDYNDGFVLPAAINKKVTVAIAKNGQPDLCRMMAVDIDEYFEFSLSNIEAIDHPMWANYLIGVAGELVNLGFSLEGFDCVFAGDVPLGSGLSSSAALESSLAFALNEIFDCDLDRITLAKIGQGAEHNYVGVKCGIMDQFASLMGKQNHVIQLDCRTLEYKYFSLNLNGYVILLCNSNVKHSHASSGYNTRRQECESGVEILQKHYPTIKKLRDVSLEMLEEHRSEFSPLIYKRCRYVIEENQRVLDACQALSQGDLNAFGAIIYRAHEGMQFEYEASCKEIDFLVDQTRDKDYVLGSRIMGGGFGGCTINFLESTKTNQFIEDMTAAYFEQFGKKLTPYLVSIEDGAKKMG